MAPPPAVEEPLGEQVPEEEKKKDDTVTSELHKTLDDIVKSHGGRMADNQTRVHRVGSKMLNSLAHLFPQVSWSLAIIAKKTKSVPPCTPHLADATARKLLVRMDLNEDTRWVAGDTEDKWDNTTFKRAPQWMIVLHGYEGDAASDEILTPSEAARITLGQHREDGELDLTLSGV